VCLFVCCVCLGVPLLFRWGAPLFPSVSSWASGFLPAGRPRGFRFGSLPASGFGVFFLRGVLVASSFSFVLPSFSSVGPASAVPAAPVRAPVSLSPLSRVSWGGPVVLERLGWEASSSSVLVWVVGSSSPVVCRVGSLAPVAVSALVAELRRLVRSGESCRLGVRGSWGGRWFCAVAPV